MGAGGYTDPTGYRLPPPTYETYDPNDGTRGGGGMGGNGGNSIGYQGNLDLLLGNVPYSYNSMGSYSLYANNPSMYGMLFGTNTWSEIMTKIVLENSKSKENNIETSSKKDGFYSNDPRVIKRTLAIFGLGNNANDIWEGNMLGEIIIYANNGNFSLDQNSFWNTWNAIQADLSAYSNDLDNTGDFFDFSVGISEVIIGNRLQTPLNIYERNRLGTPGWAKYSYRTPNMASFSKLSKASKVLGKIAIPLSIGTTYYSGYKAWSQYKTGGWNKVNKLDFADALVGTIGLGTTLGVSLGLISNPVGWAVGAGILLYGGVRLGMDIYNDYIDKP